MKIIEPHDKGISESIKANLEPKTWEIDNVRTSSLCLEKTSEMRDAYLANLSTLCLAKFVCASSSAPMHHDQSLSRGLYRSLNRNTSLKFVNTSMHGVSDPFMVAAFEQFGFPAFIPVQEQQAPDPDFPTVKFPNPEEKGDISLLC